MICIALKRIRFRDYSYSGDRCLLKKSKFIIKHLVIVKVMILSLDMVIFNRFVHIYRFLYNFMCIYMNQVQVSDIVVFNF